MRKIALFEPTTSGCQSRLYISDKARRLGIGPPLQVYGLIEPGRPVVADLLFETDG